MSESYTAFKCFAQKREHVYAIKNIGALWNFTKHLRPNFPEPYRVPAPEPSGTSPAICTGTLRNPPEPFPEPGIEAELDGTRANLG